MALSDMRFSHIKKDNLSFVNAAVRIDIAEIEPFIQEAVMAACSQELMTNHHHTDLAHPIAAIAGTLRLWRERSRIRSELAHLSDRDFHDIGASWSDYACEAGKPFWRA